MQWLMEKEVVVNSKHELEERERKLGDKVASLQKELDQLKRPPTNSRVKESTKFAIKDMIKRDKPSLDGSGSGYGHSHSGSIGQGLSSVLNKNILNKSNMNLPLRGSFVMSDETKDVTEGVDSNSNKDSRERGERGDSLRDSRDKDESRLTNNSKRLQNIGKSPAMRNKFKLNLFGDRDKERDEKERDSNKVKGNDIEQNNDLVNNEVNLDSNKENVDKK
mmetsp:Transcript_87030/g.188330  ORF Transcript_87030/g.188330 Transcript_87030/m.188330 type:complete len:220 (-) Transcript_87030:98-757(-)